MDSPLNHAGMPQSAGHRRDGPSNSSDFDASPPAQLMAKAFGPKEVPQELLLPHTSTPASSNSTSNTTQVVKSLLLDSNGQPVSESP
jgi:hypothetical protein